jgi:hypothetical protein
VRNFEKAAESGVQSESAALSDHRYVRWNGAPFKDWPLPASLERVRRKLKGSDDGDREMVKVLSAVLTDGLAAVEAACGEALSGGVTPLSVVALVRQVIIPAPAR